MVGVLSLAPCYVRKKQVRDKGVPSSYHHGKAVSSLVDDCQTMPPPPANVRSLEKKKFYICSDVTHTHTVRQANACLIRFTTKAPVIIPANIISSTKSRQLERGRSVFKLRLPRTIFPKLKGHAWRPPSGKNLPSHGLSGQSVAALWGHCNVGEELLSHAEQP